MVPIIFALNPHPYSFLKDMVCNYTNHSDTDIGQTDMVILLSDGCGLSTFFADYPNFSNRIIRLD